MEEKNSPAELVIRKTKSCSPKKITIKNWEKKREKGAFEPWSPRPCCRTITLFYTFICEKVWYYPLYTNRASNSDLQDKKRKPYQLLYTRDEWYYPIYRLVSHVLII